jgi:PAS domain S-box-containing protein
MPIDQGDNRESAERGELRRMAERLLDGALEIGADISEQGVRDLVHELSVHQIELELQNEELRRAQRALELSHHRFENLYDLAPVGHVTLNSRAVIEEANLAAAEMLGMSKRALLNAPFVLYVDPGSRKSFLRYFRAALGSKVRENCVAALRSRNGRSITARLDSRTVREEKSPSARVYMAITDVTEQRRLEGEIAISERRLRLAVEQYPAGFLIYDTEGTIDFVNSHGAELLGRRPEELAGKRIDELSPRAPEVYVQLLKRAISTATPQRTDARLEFQGGTRDYVVTFAPLFGDRGEVRQVVSVTYDVSAQKRIQEDLERAVVERTSELQRANLAMTAEIRERESMARELMRNHSKLRSLTSELIMAGERERQRLAAALHDHVGQALAFTKINLGLLRQSPLEEGAARQVDHLLSVLDQIIGDTQSLIFDLSPPVLSLLGLVPAVEWLTEKMQEEHGLGIAVSDDGKLKPVGEELRILLFQAVKELLTNVVKHARANKAAVTISRKSRKIRIVVEDDGIGMSPRQPQTAEGFGLFSIRERLIPLGGTLRIDSGSGKTRVSLEAPLSPD